MGAQRLLADAARAAQGARRRLASLVDLFLPDSMRLTDYQRVTIRRFIARLVSAIEGDLRQRLIAGHAARFSNDAIAALGSARVAIAMPILERARALHDVELVSLLLARVEEQRIATGLRQAGGSDNGPGKLVEALLSDSDPAIASAAMALVIAESRRFFVFDESAVPRSDLPADLQYRLVWWVAAALREYLTTTHAADPAQVDIAIMDVATASLSSHDEGETLESAAMQLALLLGERGWLDDDVLKSACLEGHMALFVAILAARAGFDFESARGMALPPYGERLIVLLKAVGVTREAAAAIVVALGADDVRINDYMMAYDELESAQAMEAIRPLKIDGGYRNAIVGLAAGLAERGTGWVP